MMQIIETDLELTIHNKLFLDLQEQHNLCSIQFKGLTFNSAVVTVRRTNSKDIPPLDFDTPITINAPNTLTIVPFDDFAPCRYLVLQVTTGASSTTIVPLVVIFKSTPQITV